MSTSGYIPGDFWRLCDRCGSRFRSSQTFRTWDGLYVCREDFETRHPQDFVRGRKDLQNVPNPRPDTDGPFVGPTEALTTEQGEPHRLQTQDGFYIMVET